jgi:hypothetical protein
MAAVWMRGEPAEERPAGAMPAIAGASQEADGIVSGGRCPVIIGLTLLAAAATVFFGVIPSPLVDWANQAGEAIASLF